MATETDDRDITDKTIETSNTAQYIAATVRAQAGWRGWEQRDIIRETGLRRTYVSDRWRGEKEWSINDVERIARALGMDAWSFFEFARTLSKTSIALRAPESEYSEEDEEGTVSAVDLRARNQV